MAHIPHFIIRLSWRTCFTLRPLCPQKYFPVGIVPVDMRDADSWRSCGKEENLLPSPGIEPQFVQTYKEEMSYLSSYSTRVRMPAWALSAIFPLSYLTRSCIANLMTFERLWGVVTLVLDSSSDYWGGEGGNVHPRARVFMCVCVCVCVSERNVTFPKDSVSEWNKCETD
jgi:hypothetical protein